eukprot:351327-Chlamydomonas_euryale.AAC.1
MRRPTAARRRCRAATEATAASQADGRAGRAGRKQGERKGRKGRRRRGKGVFSKVEWKQMVKVSKTKEGTWGIEGHGVLRDRGY